MKRLSLSLICFLAIVALTGFSFIGCAGRMYSKQTIGEEDGAVITHAGRTGLFGLDTGIVEIHRPAHVMPVQVQSAPLQPTSQPLKTNVIEEIYEAKGLSWGNCKDEIPNKNARNIRRTYDKKTLTREVPVQSSLPPQSPQATQATYYPYIQNSTTSYAGGGTGSVGNVALPVAIGAFGYALGQKWHRPNSANINQTGGGGGGANVEAAAASSSAASSDQIQTQTFDNVTSVDVN